MVGKNNYYVNNKLLKKIKSLGSLPIDIMITGVTGAGKSTTLNSFFQKEVSKVGKGVEPQTMELSSYRLNNYFRLWDTPGLGDGIKNDKIHSKKIIEILNKNYYIKKELYNSMDLVLVILDGGSRDMGVTYKLLNEVILQNFPKEKILVAINQADMAMKGEFWNKEQNKPEKELEEFLNEKVISIQNRIKEATSILIQKPIYYSAKCNYNIDTFFNFIVDNLPKERIKI